MTISRRIARVSELDRVLQEDSGLSDTRLHQRERSINAELQLADTSDEVLALAWYQQRFSHPLSDSGYQQMPVWAVIISALGGFLLMAGLLNYTGDLPVNIFYVLAAFVGLQLLLMLLQILVLYTGASVPSILWPLLSRLMGKGKKYGLPPVLLASVLFWLNQLGAFIFTLSAMLTLLLLISVQDIAFGWSTTLDVSALQLQSALQVFAVPWQWLWPAAVPGLETIEQTQVFRIDFSADSATPASLWGVWWQYLVMSIFCYTLIPRLFLLLWFRQRLLATIDSQYRSPPIVNLLYRLRTPVVHTGEQVLGQQNPESDTTEGTNQKVHTAEILLFWACEQTVANQALEKNPELAGIRYFMAGGKCTVEEDAAIRAMLVAEKGNLLVLTPGWEPPREELRDFLLPLTNNVVAVMLLPLPNDQERIDSSDFQSWQHFVSRLPGEVILQSPGVET